MTLRRKLLVIISALAGIGAALGVAVASSLLDNGGFNDAFTSQSGINGRVPNGWTAVNLHGDPLWQDSGSFCHCGGGNEKTEGSNAVVIVSENIEACCDQNKDGWPFDAVLYQQVHGVVSGTAYSFGASLLTFCGGTGDASGCLNHNYTMTKMVGIDPTGGTSPTAPTVIWSAPNGDNAHWRDMTVAARARSTTLSVFMRVNWPYTFHGAFTYWDASYLALAPIASINAGAANSAGFIPLTWSAVVPQDVSGDYGGIQLAYDVQVFSPLIGHWTDMLVGTQLTQANFPSIAGNTYQFRVRPFLGYPPDNHRFDGLLSDAVSVAFVDSVAPSSAVAPLPPVTLGTEFPVSWLGSDNVSPAPALRFDVQYRDGPTGPWTAWQTGTQATKATFDGQRGHTYYFRSRAHDEAGNVEAYPANGDGSTTIAFAVSGSLRNVRDEDVPLATVATVPAAATVGVSDVNGQFNLYVTASSTYSFTVVRREFGTLPAVGNVVVTTTNATGADAILPPAVDLVNNGQFESGNLNGWTASGFNAPTIAPLGHSGKFAVVLAGGAGLESSLRQTLVLSPALSRATLSYLARAPLGTSDLFTVTVSGSSTVLATTPAVGGDWAHHWLDLSPFAGQTITIMFASLPSTSQAILLLDEIEVGNADTVTIYQAFLPVVMR
jgi:hypothetical protein